MRQLCKGLPPEWWETDNDGARLALAVCRVCPHQPRCLEGDPRPHGVVRAGRAYSDTGEALPLCPCGYPQATRRPKAGTRCLRCRLPGLDRFAGDIKRWAARNDSYSAMGRRIGSNRTSIRDALARWARTDSTTEGTQG